MATTATERPRPKRSENLLPEEIEAIEKKITELGTKYDVALFFGFSRVTLDNILLRKSGKESTVKIIREKLAA